MNQTERLSALIASITTSIKLLDTLKELFVVHGNTLKNRDLDALEDANTALAEHMLLIKDNFAARLDLQQQLCGELSEERWQAFVQTLDSATQAQLNQAWDKLEKTLLEVQQLSQVNQQVVRRGQRQIDELVNILQGKNRANRVYDQRGGSAHINTQSTLGKA